MCTDTFWTSSRLSSTVLPISPCPKFLYTKLHRPSNGILVGSTALKALLKTLVYVVFTFIICQNTHSTNTTCAFNPLLQVCKWFGESVFITLVVTSWAIYLTGRSSQIYRHFHGWVRATLYRETLPLVYIFGCRLVMAYSHYRLLCTILQSDAIYETANLTRNVNRNLFSIKLQNRNLFQILPLKMLLQYHSKINLLGDLQMKHLELP